MCVQCKHNKQGENCGDSRQKKIQFTFYTTCPVPVTHLFPVNLLRKFPHLTFSEILDNTRK